MFQEVLFILVKRIKTGKLLCGTFLYISLEKHKEERYCNIKFVTTSIFSAICWLFEQKHMILSFQTLFFSTLCGKVITPTTLLDDILLFQVSHLNFMWQKYLFTWFSNKTLVCFPHKNGLLWIFMKETKRPSFAIKVMNIFFSLNIMSFSSFLNYLPFKRRK